jgi:molecular chaperone GrpE
MTKSKKEKIEEYSEKMKEEIPDTESLPEEAEQFENQENDLKLEYDKLNDKYLRKIAEFENYKRRTDAEKSEFFAFAGQKLIADLLPVLDDFERVLKAYDDKHDSDSLKKGVELVYEKFRGILAKHGLKQIDSDGKEFDVNLHEALFQQPDEKAKPNTVITTHEKGYYLKNKVLRHAKVVVSTKPDEK